MVTGLRYQPAADGAGALLRVAVMVGWSRVQPMVTTPLPERPPSVELMTEIPGAAYPEPPAPASAYPPPPPP